MEQKQKCVNMEQGKVTVSYVLYVLNMEAAVNWKHQRLKKNKKAKSRIRSRNLRRLIRSDMFGSTLKDNSLK